MPTSPTSFLDEMLKLHNPADVARGIQQFVAGLKDLRTHKDEDSLKRWYLTSNGWTFNRKKDKWTKNGKEVNSYQSFEKVVFEIISASK